MRKKISLIIDLDRYGLKKYTTSTGILVRAQRPDNGEWVATDITTLTRKSLTEWLMDSPVDAHPASKAVAVVLAILGHTGGK